MTLRTGSPRRTGCLAAVFLAASCLPLRVTAQPAPNPGDVYPPAPGVKPVFLNIIWHQHQPMYVNPVTDQLSGPWVRTHATKDYYDMAAGLKDFPDIRCTINLTSTLLLQLRRYYIDRLGPYIDIRSSRMDVPGFLSRWRGKTDPWIDLALRDPSTFDGHDRDFLYRNAWSAFSVSDVQIARFPEFRSLRDRVPPGGGPDSLFSPGELREIIFWFYLSEFDPGFLLGPVHLPDGSVCDLSGYLAFRSDSTFVLKKKITGADCVRMVVEAYKVMANVIPIHRSLSGHDGTGQVELITTPYAHPILPLIFDSDIARTCQPSDSLPERFSYPSDAQAQVAKAVHLFTSTFGVPPDGMWPGEGALSQGVLPVFADNGIRWSAGDVKVLAKSSPSGMPNTTPYRFPAGGGRWLSLVFRDTDLSDRIGFTYQYYTGEEGAEDFIRAVLARAPLAGERDVLVTVILDGENAWENYRRDIDGKQFLNALYRKLTALYAGKRIITTTTSEYIRGNPLRGIPPHPVTEEPEMKSLWPGSWINANYDTWIGEKEENLAWGYLLRTRRDLDRAGIVQPDPALPAPAEGSAGRYAWNAWEEMYAAEGSDWFWWFGDDQTAPGGDRPFDDAFLNHLNNVYAFAQKAGSSVPSPGFTPIITGESAPAAGQGVMARSGGDPEPVLFTCDARGVSVTKSICIVGNLPQLGNWEPNLVHMRDDGLQGDSAAGDGIWSFRTVVPSGVEVQYKYTNSGRAGEWSPGEEFPLRHRSFTIHGASPAPRTIRDTFGR
jgi:alpha-amylase/alpha-mannosidase (GH57 family)